MKILSLIILSAMLGFAAQTVVTDTIKDGAGNPVSGTMYITPAVRFVSNDGTQVYPVPTAVQIGADGVFTVSLYPNDVTTNPSSGTSYRVRYTLDGPPGFPGQTPVETWSVPTSGSPVGLSSVRISPAPTPSISGYITSLNGLTSVSQLFARVNDTNVTLSIGSAVSTHTFTMGWTGLLAVARGGTGVGTLTGLVKGNGTSAFSAATAGTDYIGGVGNLTTAGAVPYVSSTGTLNQDGADFFYDSTNNRLCIGCASGWSATTEKLLVTSTSSIAARVVAASGNNNAEVVIESGGGGSSGDNADLAFGAVGAVDLWRVGGVWNGGRGFFIRDSLAGYVARFLIEPTTGNVLIGPPGSESDQNTKFSVLSSGSARTVLIQDQTPTTGITSIGVIAGAGQSTNNLMLAQGTTYQGVWDSQGQYSAAVVGGDRKVVLYAYGGLGLTSDMAVRFRSTVSLDTGSDDTCLVRNSASFFQSTCDAGTTNGGFIGSTFILSPASASRPTCNVGHRGWSWYEANGSGVKDTIAYCAKDVADAYAWRTVY